jgi:hypothetical protein
MSRDTMIDIAAIILFLTIIAAFVVAYILACKMDARKQQEPVEISGLEAFTPEYMEMYETGLWLLLHNTEAPYDDL